MPASTPSELDVDDGAIRLKIETSGSGRPFVWAHPLLASMCAERRSGVFDWSGSESLLVRYDARSHGGSTADPAAEHHEWEVLAADMLAVATHAGAERAVFGGASMGAATALWVAHLAPERVEGLVLVIPPTAWESRSNQSRLYRGLGMAAATRVLWPATLGLRLPRPTARRGTRRALSDAVLDELSRSDPHRIAPPLRGAAASDLPTPEQLSRISAPTLILAWAGDRSHPVSVAKRLATTIPNAELHVAGSDLSDWPDLVSNFLTNATGKTSYPRS